jgi:hypothetical protein
MSRPVAFQQQTRNKKQETTTTTTTTTTITLPTRHRAFPREGCFPL